MATDSFLVSPSGSLRRRAVSAAGRLGLHPAPGEPFPDFWARVPVAERTAVRTAELAHQPDHGARILFSSGGSTGSPKFTSLSFTEMLGNCAVHGRGYASCGVGPGDVVAVWGLPGLMTSEFTVYLGLAGTGCCVLPIGVSDPPTIVDMVRSFRATVLLVMPSDLVPVMAHLDRTGTDLSSVRLVLTGGEPMYPADEQRFRRRFAAGAAFRSVLQTSEVGTIGYQCASSAFGEYHVHHDLQLVEIVDPGADGTGHLVTTNVARGLDPVVRRRTGDLARRLDGRCGCGEDGPRIMLCGRTGMVVKLGGEKFDIGLLAELRRELGLSMDDFKIVLDRDATGCDRITLRSRRLSHDPGLQEIASRAFSALTPTVAAQLRHGVVAPLHFEPMRPEDLTRTVAGKTQMFADIRSVGTSVL